MIKLPKNIRQIGTCTGTLKIYMEDYVETWTRQYAENMLTECAAAVFIGSYQTQGEESAVFLYGAVKADCIEEGKIRFTERVWTDIYEDIKKYFPDGEIMGWFLGGPSFLLEADTIQKVHADHFAGKDKVLLKYDALEQEEAFYVRISGRMTRQDGYYIYYDRNEGMQNYMIDHRLIPGSTEESFQDDTTQKIRRTVEENKERAARLRNERKQRLFPEPDASASKRVFDPKDASANKDSGTKPELKGMKGLVYTAGTLAAAAVLIIGASALNRYERLQEDALPVVAGSHGRTEAESTEEAKDEGEKESAEPDGTAESADSGEETKEPASGDNEAQNTASEELVTEEPQEESLSEMDRTEETDPTVTPEPPGPSESAGVSDSAGSNTSDGQEASDGASEDSEETAGGAVLKSYIVQKGDTLLGISWKLYQSPAYIEEIKELNQIENEDLIYIGQELIVP